MPIPLRHRLSTRQAVSTLLLALCLGLVTSMLQIRRDLAEELDQARLAIQHVAAMLEDAASHATYDLDGDLAQRVADGFMLHPPVQLVEIYDDFGAVLARDSRPPHSGGWAATHMARQFFHDLREHSFDLRYGPDDLFVGRVRIVLDPLVLADGFIRRAWRSLLGGVAPALILALILGGMFYLTLTRPLVRMAQNLATVDPETPDAAPIRPPVGHGLDEMGLLAVSINDLLRRLAQNLLRRAAAEEKYRSIFENALEGIYQTTPDGQLVSCNPASARFFGYDTPEEFMRSLPNISKDIYAYPHDRTLFLKRLLEEGAVTDFEVQLRHRDGSHFWALLTGKPVYDARGELVLVEGMLMNIDERKEAQIALEAMNQDLELLVEERTEDLHQRAYELEAANIRLRDLDEMKSALLSTVSHDLRTPLTSVLGFAKLVNRDFSRVFGHLAESDDTLRQYAQRIHANLGIIESEGERLTRLINDFLDLSKIESGRMEWLDTTLDLGEILLHTIQATRGQLAQKPDLAIHADIAPDLPPILGDRDRIQQIFGNLLGNAIKYSDHGQIIVRAFQARSGNLEVQIHDSGRGIPAQDLPHIFDKFYQVSRGDTLPSSDKGTGLGLAICKEIVDHYHGRLWAESTHGRGSVFHVVLPPVE